MRERWRIEKPTARRVLIRYVRCVNVDGYPDYAGFEWAASNTKKSVWIDVPSELYLFFCGCGFEINGHPKKVKISCEFMDEQPRGGEEA